MRYEVVPIGVVSSPLTDPASAPKQGSEGSPEAWLVFEPDVVEGLRGLAPGDRVLVLTWLDRARRDVLRVHPRDDPLADRRGVFTTRSADRPNPIGLHEVTIMSISGGRFRVRDLEAVDGTPILDVKPLLGAHGPGTVEAGPPMPYAGVMPRVRSLSGELLASSGVDRRRLEELLELIEAHHRTGLRRLLGMIRAWRGEIFMEAVMRDDVAGSYLASHDLDEPR